MELKRENQVDFTFDYELLIVPYGIETSVALLPISPFKRLLIVPYGIETFLSRTSVVLHVLLIVPYGIETRKCRIPYGTYRTFNRTLWN